MSEEQVRRELDRPLEGGVTVGINSGVFSAVCVANIDGDEMVDMWSLVEQPTGAFDD